MYGTTTGAPARRRTARRAGALVALLGGALGALLLRPAGAADCSAATISWDGGAGTASWHTAANWTDDRLPVAGDHVCVPAMTPAVTVVHSTGTTTVASLQVNGAVTVSGGTLAVTDTAAPSQAERLTLSGGALGGAGTVEVTGVMTWTGGRMNGAGTTRVAPGGRLDVANAWEHVYLDAGRTLSNDGTVVQTSSNGYVLYAANDVVIRNAGSWDASGTYSTGIYNNAPSGTTRAVVRNLAGGVLRRTSGTPSFSVQVPATNDGTISTAFGSIRLTAGGEATAASGTFGANTYLDGGTFPLSGATLDGATVSGATVTVTGTVTVPASKTAAQSSGVVNGTGTLHVAGTYSWSAGRQAGTGTTYVPAGGRLNLANTSDHLYLDAGRTLSSDGTVAQSSSNGYVVYAANDVTIRNAGLWEAGGGYSSGLYSNAPSGTTAGMFRNEAAGVLRRATGSNVTFQVNVRARNDGTVGTAAGTIRFAAGGDGTASAGTFGANTYLDSGAFPLSGATLNGVAFSGATVTLSGTTTVPDGGTATQTGGTVNGTGTLRVEGTYTWTAGRMAGTGTTYVPAGGRLNLANTNDHLYLDAGRTLSSDGTVAQSSSNGYVVYAANDVVIRNGGTWDVSGTYSTGLHSNAPSGTTLAVLRNEAGAVLRRVSGTPSFSVNVRTTNDGTISAVAGSVRLAAGSEGVTAGGTFGSGVFLDSGTFPLSGATLNGATIAGATVNAVGTVTVPATGTATHSGGTVNGTGTLRVEGTYTWTSGRMAGTGTTFVAPGARLTMANTNDYVYLDSGRSLTNEGTVSFAPGNGYVAYAYNDVVIRNRGAWEIGGAYSTGIHNQASSGTTPAAFLNEAAGTLLRTSGTSTFTMGIRFANDGTVSTSVGSIRVNAGGTGGTDAGSWGANVYLDSGSFTLSGATFSGAALSGANVTVADTLTIAPSTTTALSGGVLGGPGTVTVSGTLAWTGGRMSGSGTTHVPAGGRLDLANTGTHLYLDAGRQLSNDGLVAVASGNGYGLFAANDVVIRNAGTWTVSGTISTSVQANNAAGTTPPVFRNLAGATLRRSSGATSLTLAIRFANDGLVEATAGSVRLTAGDDGVAHAGTFGAGVFLDSGTFGLSGGTLAGAALSGATVRADGTVTVPVGSTVPFSGGAVTGTGTFDVLGTVAWSAGRMSGTGTTAVAAGGTLQVTNSGTHLYLDTGRTLVNDGTVAWTPSSGYGLYLSPDVVVRNAGLWQVSSTISTGIHQQGASNAVFRNLATGVFRRTSGSTSTTIGVRFANDGVVEAVTGSTILNGGDDGVAHGGAFGTGTSFSSGTYLLDGATLTGTTLNGATITATGTVAIPASTTSTLTGGTVNGAGTLDVAGTLTWSGGRMAGTGTTLVRPAGRLNVTHSGTHLYVDAGRTLLNEGLVAWTPSSGYGLYVAPGAVLRNAATWETSSTISTGIYENGTGATPAVLRNDAGAVFRRTSGATSTTIGVRLVNEGVVDAVAGSVRLTGGDDGAAHAGTFGPGLSFDSGTYTLSGATLRGVGINGANVRANGPVTLAAGTASTLTGGWLSGTGSVDVEGSLSWSGGRMSGTGTTRVAPGATLTIGNSGSHLYVENGRTLSNEGTVAWTPSSGYGLYAQPGVVLRNAGTWTVAGGISTGIYADGAGTPAPVLRNLAGATFRRVSGATTATIAIPVANAGTIDALAGSVRLAGGSEPGVHPGTFGSGVFLDAGSWTLDGATLAGATISGATVRTDTSLTLAGSSALVSGTLGGTGTVDVLGAVTWSGGRMTDAGITRVAATGSLAISPGSTLTLDGARSLVNEGAVTWTTASGWSLNAGAATVLRNAGTWTAAGGGSGTIADASGSGTAPLFLNTGTVVRTGTGTATVQVPFDNQGTVRAEGGALRLDGRLLNYSSSRETLTAGTFEARGGTLRLGTGRVVTNAATLAVEGGSLLDASNAALLRDLARVTGNGELRVSGTTVATSARLTSSGRVVVGAGGTLTAAGGYAQAAGTTTLADATAHLGPTADVAGGDLSGVGTVDGALTATGGTVSPGTAAGAGTLTVAGPYTHGEGATLVADVTATGYDVLAAGDVSLDGRLRMRPEAGVAAVDGTRYQVVTHTSRTGRFGGVEGDPGTGLAYFAEHEPNAVAAVVRPASARETGGSVVIDGGAAYATARGVALSIVTGASAVEMRVSNDAVPTGAYTAVTGTVAWNLADLDGTRTVYVQFRDEAGNESTPVSDTIVLDRRPAKATLTTPTAASGAVVATFDEVVTGVTTANVAVRVGSTAVSATLACADASGASVDCATGLVRTVTLRPTAAFAPGVTYTAWVNPAGAATLVRDRAGNATAATSRSFTVGL